MSFIELCACSSGVSRTGLRGGGGGGGGWGGGWGVQKSQI